LLLVLVLVLAGLCLPAAAEQPLRLQRFKLTNGLEVILAEDHRLPQVAINLWLHAGPRDETPQQTGFAYLFEHLMFAGSRHIPRGEADLLVENAGGSDFGSSTNFDRSSYSLTLPSNQLELGLWIQSDMLGWMIDGVDAAALAAQQAAIRDERRRTAENRPYGIVDEAVYAALFPPGHPYRAAVIGSHADIQAMRLPEVQAFARSHYRPNNASLVLAGSIDPVRARNLVQRYFGSLQAGPVVPVVQVAQPVIRSERRLVVGDEVALPRVTLAWHTPAAFKPDDAELDLAAAVLGGGRAGRLYKALIEDQQLAQSIDVSQYALSLGSVFSIEVVARPGRTLAEVEAALETQIEALASTPASAAELQRAQAGSETRLYHRMEKLGGLAEQLNLYQRFGGTASFITRDLARYRNATPESVRAAVAAYLRPSARVVVHGVPGVQVLPPPVPAPDPAAADTSERIAMNAAEAWRKLLPPPGPPAATVLPDGKRQQLRNGLTVLHVPRPGLPLVSATLVVRAGLDRNPPDRPGLASFTAAMLEQGTRQRSAAELADAVARLGASLAIDFGAEEVRITVAAMAAKLPAALDLVAEMVLRPAFHSEGLARLKLLRAAALQRQRESPASIADSLARAAYFGPGHPLGRNGLGDEAAIAETTRNEILTFWRANYRPDEAALVVSGDVDQASVMRLAQASFGAWRAPPGNTPEWQPPAAQPTAARVVLVDQPGAPSTTLQLIAAGPQAEDPDAAAAVVLNNAFAGLAGTAGTTGTTGATRGGPSSFTLGRSQASWVLRANLRSEATTSGLAALLQQIAGLRQAPLAEGDLLRARNAGLLALPGEFDTNDAITMRLARAWSLNLPPDHHANWPRRLAAVGADDAQAVARARLAPQELTLVAVGDLARLRAAVQALGLGPVEVRDARGALLSPASLPAAQPPPPRPHSSPALLPTSPP